MLRIVQSKSVSQAKNYYTESLRHGDYYVSQSQQQELVGHWHGTAAERLGLAGNAVTESAFFALADNRHPQTGDPLTGRTKADRTVGYDFNFHAPKSLSLLYNITEDQRIVEQFQHAVQNTMVDLQQDMRTRVRSGGQNTERTTSNMVWGDFTHHTSRPVEGVPDPHLHMHCFAFNATFDETEQKWKAGQFRDIKRDASYFEAVFHAHLAKSISELGYSVKRTGQGPAGWEVAAVQDSALKKFQHRTDLIEAEAKRLGLEDDALKDQLGAKTRESKNESRFTFAELREIWKKRLTGSESNEIRLAEGTPYHEPKITPQQAITGALEHCFERQSVLPERDVQKQALKNGVGSINIEQFYEQWLNQDVIKADIAERWSSRRMVTTPAVLLEERRMMEFVREGRGRFRPLGREEFQIQPVQTDSGQTFELNVGQKAAIKHLLASTDRVTAIRGAAGVGKTTLMQQAVNGLRDNGREVFTFAPSADASRGVLRSEGFHDAQTVARLLLDQELQQKVNGSVIWIDEAGLLSTKDLQAVFKIADKQAARIVLSGDTKQHASVARGDAFRILQDLAGLNVVEVTEILRQKPDAYKAAISDISQGNVEAGFAKLDAMGAIREVAEEERYLELAAAYLDVTSQRQGMKQKTALVVSPTHREGDRVTEVIRNTLKADGKIGSQDNSVLQFKNLQLTEAQRKDFANYQTGQVVQFHQHAKGFKRGERVEVVDIDPVSGVLVKNSDGFTVNLPLKSAKQFSVYEPSELNVAAGDRIRITANGKTADGKHRLNNGAIYKIKNITSAGELVLENNWILSQDFGHLTHGFVTTSHASQGKSVDTVLIAQSSESYAASHREQFYVSASRGKESVLVFTDNREMLQQAVQRTGERLAASELSNLQTEAALRREKSREFVQRMQHWSVQAQTIAAQAAAAAYRFTGTFVEQTLNELNKPKQPQH